MHQKQPPANVARAKPGGRLGGLRLAGLGPREPPQPEADDERRENDSSLSFMRCASPRQA